jgi:trimeric autotransporter adhesin
MAPVYDPAHVDDGGTLDMTLPAKADRLGKSLVFNATTGNPEAGPTSTDIANAQPNATAAAASAAAAAASETAAGVSEAAAASYASPVTETFADTVGFTAGTSTTITLAATVVEDAVIITFDGVTQHHDTYSISGTTVTFTSTIPVGVLAIEASYGTRSTGAIDNIIIGANTPAAGSFTTVNGVTPATAQYTTTLDTKLGGIEALADVTDATNVTAAGALMDSELTSIASVKALNQGVATTDTPTFAGIITSGNVDGRDVSVDGTKLDGIEAAADVTDATNVTAAGALMDSELTDIAAVKALDQGVATTDSPTFAADCYDADG